MGNTVSYYVYPEVTPHDKSPIKHDPLKGFPEGARKKKEFKVTAAEIESMQIPIEFLDYCLHKQLEWKKCQAEVYPWVNQCQHLIHEHQACGFEEYKDRLRDYERERRLMIRKQKRLERERKKQSEELKA